MALVIKSWAVNPNPPAGQPHVQIVGRESGLISFVLSLLGIDATTTLAVNARHIEYERGSLSGFERWITPMEHVSSTYYGRVKPWKTASVIAGLGLLLGFSAPGIYGLIFVLIGVGLAGVYYFLARNLTLGFIADSGKPAGLTFRRSVIEGQEINEDSLRSIITLIEHLIKPSGDSPAIVAVGGRPSSDRAATLAPLIKKELTPAGSVGCPKCGTPTTPDEIFCGSCGHKLR